MKSRKVTRTTFVALFLCALLAFAGGVSAQTPDGQTPAEETVCDPLRADGVTKGLYGLCVAFCEAHDAADASEPLTEGQFDDMLASSPNGRLLKNYNRKKSETDPDMPCVRVEEPCPCWTSEQLSGTYDGLSLDGTAASKGRYDGFGSPTRYAYCWDTSSTSFERILSYDYYGDLTFGVCQGVRFDHAANTYDVVTLWYYGEGNANNSLTQGELANCRAAVINQCEY